jgi:hypothetical protein
MLGPKRLQLLVDIERLCRSIEKAPVEPDDGLFAWSEDALDGLRSAFESLRQPTRRTQ